MVALPDPSTLHGNVDAMLDERLRLLGRQQELKQELSRVEVLEDELERVMTRLRGLDSVLDQIAAFPNGSPVQPKADAVSRSPRRRRNRRPISDLIEKLAAEQEAELATTLLQALTALVELQVAQGNADASPRQVAAAGGIEGANGATSAHSYLERLAKYGLVERVPGSKPARFRLTKKAWGVIKAPRAAHA